jgi:ubiquinone/menaquinone biosynthesis C-methylase UbiE
MNSQGASGADDTGFAGPSLALDDEILARDYDQISARFQFLTGQQLVNELAVKVGERVLDVGCGTGLLTEHIANLIGPSGHVLGIDPLPLRISLASARSHQSLEFQVGDAYDLTGFPAASFDVVCLNAVFHWLPEKMGPLREFARLLKPGGRLGIGSRSGHRQSSLRDAMARVMAQTPFSEHPYQQTVMSEPLTEQRMVELLRAAGFVVATLEVKPSIRTYSSAEEVLRFSEASSFGNLLSHLPEEHRPSARESLKRELEDVARASGLQDERIGMIAIGIRQ